MTENLYETLKKPVNKIDFDFKKKQKNLHPFVVSSAESEYEAIQLFKRYHKKTYGRDGEGLPTIVKIERKPSFVIWYRTAKN